MNQNLCVHCNKTVEPSDKFCPNCGKSVQQTDQSKSSSAKTFTSSGNYSGTITKSKGSKSRKARMTMTNSTQKNHLLNHNKDSKPDTAFCRDCGTPVSPSFIEQTNLNCRNKKTRINWACIFAVAEVLGLEKNYQCNTRNFFYCKPGKRSGLNFLQNWIGLTVWLITI